MEIDNMDNISVITSQYSTYTVDSMNNAKFSDTAYEMEMNLLKERKEEYLEIVLQQADVIKELKEQIKAKDTQILDLQNKLTEESNI